MIGVVDIGGTKIAAGVVDAEGQLRGRHEEPTHPERGFRQAIERIVSLLRDAAADAPLSGIGVGSTGPIDRETGIFGQVDVLPGWRGENVKSALGAAFPVPIVIENDADAAALGEAAHGAGRGVSRFVYVTVSTGIGGGIVIDGALYRGAGGVHPELGHHVIEATGPACACGAVGCWEALASGPALAAWARPRAPEALRGDLTAEAVCEHALAGEAWAREAVEREAFYLGVGLANVIATVAPEVIAFGGGVMRSAPLFLDRIQAIVGRNAVLVPASTTAIVPATLGANAVLLGAARAFTLAKESERP